MMMKQLRIGVSLAAVSLAALVVAVPVARAAQPLPAPVSVMVVDEQEIVDKSKAGQAIKAQRDKYAKGFQADLEAGGKTLKAAEEALMKQQSTLSREAWEEKAKAFEKQVFEFNQQFQKANVALEKAYMAAMSELVSAVGSITQEMAAELSSNLVLYKSQVFLHDPAMNRTAEIIAKLDEKYPTINFPTPEVLPKAAQQKGGGAAAPAGKK